LFLNKDWILQKKAQNFFVHLIHPHFALGNSFICTGMFFSCMFIRILNVDFFLSTSFTWLWRKVISDYAPAFCRCGSHRQRKSFSRRWLVPPLGFLRPVVGGETFDPEREVAAEKRPELRHEEAVNITSFQRRVKCPERAGAIPYANRNSGRAVCRCSSASDVAFSPRPRIAFELLFAWCIFSRHLWINYLLWIRDTQSSARMRERERERE